MDTVDKKWIGQFWYTKHDPAVNVNFHFILRGMSKICWLCQYSIYHEGLNDPNLGYNESTSKTMILDEVDHETNSVIIELKDTNISPDITPDEVEVKVLDQSIDIHLWLV